MRLTMTKEYEDQHCPVPSLEDESVIPTIELSKCEYLKHMKVLGLASEYMGMPKTFNVRSHYTGKVVRFVTVQPGDHLFNEDGWDGEQQIYRPVDRVPNVEYMVIYHQY